MTQTRTPYEHVVLDDSGAALIAGTTLKVIELVAERLAYGWSPEELQFQHPSLSLGQVHSALAYFCDHADALNAEIDRRLDAVQNARRQAGASPLAGRLRAQGLLR